MRISFEIAMQAIRTESIGAASAGPASSKGSPPRVRTLGSSDGTRKTDTGGDKMLKEGYLKGHNRRIWSNARVRVRVKWASAAVLVACTCIANAQQVVVDWASKAITSQPATVEKATKATVRIDNVNDLMFTYSISYQLKPAQISDFDAVAKAFSIAGKAAGEAVSCDFSSVLVSMKDFTDAEEAFHNLPATNKGCSEAKPCNVTLQQALDAWQQSVQPKLVSAQSDLATFIKSCPSDNYEQAIKAANDSLNVAEATVNGPHSIQKANAIELLPDNVTSLEVDQLWKDTPTTDGSYSVDLTPSNNRLNLSAGALFSEIQNRSYAVRTVPSGTGTANVLSVDGISRFSPTAIALLNYEIPRLDWERFGFAVSTGPVFRLGSKSDTSSFGYFAGLSMHLFHRFYVTPGYHLGEYADFPAGFSQPNQVVPTGFATPIPIKRWTWRFGFALSYKAKDFGQFGLSGSVNQSSSPAANKTGTSSGKKN